jgi:hypothetical protein
MESEKREVLAGSQLTDLPRRSKYVRRRMGERKLMRKRITLLVAALMLALTMALSGAAFADNGFTTTTKNPQNKETSGNCKSPQQTCTVTNRGGQTVVGQSE